MSDIVPSEYDKATGCWSRAFVFCDVSESGILRTRYAGRSGPLAMQHALWALGVDLFGRG